MGTCARWWAAADYALYVGDPVLFSRVDAIYRYVRSQGHALRLPAGIHRAPG